MRPTLKSRWGKAITEQLAEVAQSGELVVDMRSAALEVARDNITINGVLPGKILTEGLEGQGQQYLDQMTRSVPMHRLGTERVIWSRYC